METRSESLSRGTVLEGDVCIVGAGPAGLTIARELERAGRDVVVLESGDVDPTPRGQDRCVADIAGRPYPADTSRERGFGGTSLRWGPPTGLRARPLDPADFEARSGLAPEGWPFGFDELAVHYDRAATTCGLPSFAGLDADVADRARAQDWLVIASDAVESRFFQRGDPDAFQHMRDPVRASDRIHLVLNATATQVQTVPDGSRVDRIDAVGDDGRPFAVRARLFVLAGGGIENPRLLLASRSREAAGLGNAHDLVGRYFMEHPHIHTGRLVLDRRADAGRLSALYGGFQASDPWPWIEGLLMLRGDVQAREGLPNVGFWLHPSGIKGTVFGAVERVRDALTQKLQGTGDGDLRRGVGQLRRDLEAAADLPLQRLLARQSHNRHLEMEVESEQIPNPDSRVTLSDERDDLGQPRARVDWRLADDDLDAIRRSQELLDAELRRVGIGRVVGMLGDESPPTHIGIGNHHMGTTRMGASAFTSVVDPQGRMHDVANLYVTGSSVFPRGGAANPTLTIVALAHRLADELATQLRRAAPGLERPVIH